MKNQIKASLSEMSAQQTKTSAQVQDTAAEVQSLATELREHDEKVAAAQLAAAEAVKNVAQKQENAAATVDRLAGALEGFMQFSVRTRNAQGRGIMGAPPPPQAKINAALLAEKLEAAAERWIEAESLLPAAINRARLPFMAAAAIVHMEICDLLWRARIPQR